MKNYLKAVFLDRDGVLNQLVWNVVTKAYESPHRPEDLALCPGVDIALKQLRQAGYKLFVVSNQPSYAKGKASMESLIKIADKFEEEIALNGIYLDQSFYCFHHPNGVVPGYSTRCLCRKPEPLFLFQAQKNHGIDLSVSWMIGDRDSDIECGRRAGCRTILVKNPCSFSYQGKSRPDNTACNLPEAVNLILN